MTLCSIKAGIINLCLQSEPDRSKQQSCLQRFWVTKQSKKRWIGVSSFDLQKGYSGVLTFQKTNILFR